MEHKIKPIPICKGTDWPLTAFTYLGGFMEPVETRVYIWYIDGPEEDIIIDAGGSADTLTELGFSSEQIQEPRDGLEDLGLEPEDIDKVIATHLHNDHFEYGNKYPNATFLVQRREYAFAKNPHPVEAGMYVPVQEALEKADIELIEGTTEISDGVRVHLTPGHSPGGQSVEVDTSEGKAILTGFCCLDETYNPPEEFEELMEIFAPGIHTEARDVYDSALWAKKNSDILIPNHEPRFEGKVIPDDLEKKKP